MVYANSLEIRTDDNRLMPETLKALPFARNAHDGQYRKSGEV